MTVFCFFLFCFFCFCFSFLRFIFLGPRQGEGTVFEINQVNRFFFFFFGGGGGVTAFWEVLRLEFVQVLGGSRVRPANANFLTRCCFGGWEIRFPLVK